MKRVIGVLAFALIGLAPTTAYAQDWGLQTPFGQQPFWEKPAPTHRAESPPRAFSTIKCAQDEDLPSNVFGLNAIIIVLCSQAGEMVYSNGERVAFDVSTGRPGRLQTKPGLYTACDPKGPNHRSKKYDAPMAWAVYLCDADGKTDGTAIHAHSQVVRSGKPYGQSHGCIRVPGVTAKQVNDLVTSAEPGSIKIIVVRDVQEFYTEYVP